MSLTQPDTAPLLIVVQDEFVDIIRETAPTGASPVAVGAVADPAVQATAADAARRARQLQAEQGEL
ncbi:hypothetical protein [Kocuria aegyptia]|uniref:Uncharacterized protein n=1 Tax=Kocuria aegyptia TaxID=330943 RepID=A0ABP4W5I4_9MICC